MERSRNAWGAVMVAALLLQAARASAAEPDSAEPSVCSPPCAEGETCVGTSCVGPSPRRAPSPPAPAEAGPPPPAAASGMAELPRSSPPPSPAQSASAGVAPGDRPPNGSPPPPPGSFHSYPTPPRTTVVSAAPAGSRRKLGFFMLPYLGLHSFQNHQAVAYGPGLRIGSLFGGSVGQFLSINGEVTIDRAKINSPIDLEQWFFRISLSPLVHLPAGPAEVALGPRLGIYSVSTNYTGTGTTIESASSGYSTGLNAGVFVPMSPAVAIAGLLSFDLMWSKRTCASGLGGENQCGSTTDVGKVLGLTGGVLF